MKTLKDIKRDLLADPAALAEYQSQAAEFDMARELIAARARAGLTQSDVAQRMGTTQSAIARLEGGKRAPSLRMCNAMHRPWAGGRWCVSSRWLERLNRFALA
ncbi:helix-turn-helix domain-containing protein [Roseateles sp. GG27B]